MPDRRYSFHCVAPEVQGPGSTDDLDEALLFTCSYYGSHFDIYDNLEGKYVQGIHCQEDEDDLRTRLAARDSLGYALATDGFQRPPVYSGTLYHSGVTWKDKLVIWSVRKVLGLLKRVDAAEMTLKQNWNKTPEIPHRTILKVCVVIWAVIVAWMMIVGIDPVIILTVPALVLALIYLTARLAP